jgi:hypothetical protein
VSAAGDWQLERYLLGELPAAEAEAVRAALERDPALRARLQALELSNTEILERHPPPAIAAAVRARAAAAPAVAAVAPRPRLALAAALGAAAVLAGVLVLRPWPAAGPPGPEGDVTRLKGAAPRLVLYRQRPGGAEALGPGAGVRAGDVVQLSYHAAGRRYGVIVSVDGRGAVTRHLPVAGETAAPLSGGAVALPEAYRLDDAPRFERFYLVAADEPFPVAAVVAALPRGGDDAEHLRLPARWAVESVLLRKEPGASGPGAP